MYVYMVAYLTLNKDLQDRNACVRYDIRIIYNNKFKTIFQNQNSTFPLIPE